MSSKKNSGGKLSRSETVTVRFDPKLRYMAELAARKHRRTLSSFVEWAVEQGLDRVCLNDETGITLGHMIGKLWDIDEADRLVKLALRYPELLTHDEQLIWKLIKDNGYLWNGVYKELYWAWEIKEENLIYERLREHWETFKKVAKGELSKDDLPKWQKEEHPF